VDVDKGITEMVVVFGILGDLKAPAGLVMLMLPT
jgi:hypothetical protein